MKKYLSTFLILFVLGLLCITPISSHAKSFANDGEDSGWWLARISKLLDQYVKWPVQKSKIVCVNLHCNCTSNFSVEFNNLEISWVGVVISYDEAFYRSDISYAAYYDNNYNLKYTSFFDRLAFNQISFFMTKDGRVIERDDIIALLLY